MTTAQQGFWSQSVSQSRLLTRPGYTHEGCDGVFKHKKAVRGPVAKHLTRVKTAVEFLVTYLVKKGAEPH